MKKRVILGAASLVFLAGQAMAQTGAVDGRLTDSGERALYGAAKWVSTSTTNWGDAGPSNPCDPSGTGGDPAAVSTGVEFKIPLSTLGNPAANVRLLAFINGSGHDYASNQFLPSLPSGTGNLGGNGSGGYIGNMSGVDLGAFAGNQYLTVNLASLASGSPTVDGTLDAAYGSAKALQACRTGFGNATNGTQAANGSELDGMYVVRDAEYLYVFLSGNMETNFNKLELLIDTDEATNGTNPISSGNTPDVDFGALGKLNGMTFDAGFAPDYYFTFGAGGGGPDYYPNFAVIGVEGGYMGTNIVGNGSGILAGGNARGCEISLNNANAGGVAGGCPPPAGNADNANGSEINAVYSYVNNGRLHVLVTGNLESGGGTPCDAGGNKLNLFLDADGQGGQNVLLGNNVDISYGNLNRMAGLTFESDFAADYWMSIKTGGNTPYMVMDCSVLRTGGKRTNALGSPLDYGAYDGGNKADYNPVTFRGNFVPCNGNPNDPMIQDGFTANLYTNYGPRAAAESLFADNFNPVGTPGLLSFSINNSNFGGVQGRGGSVADAANVSTGIEFSIDLVELGWDGSSCIKLAGFVANGDASYASNQVIGGLPGGTDTNDLQNPTVVNFGNIEGTQYVVVAGSCGGGGGCPPCAADFNNDGGVDGGDIEAFFAAWEGGDSCGDVNQDGGVDGGDIEAFFSVWENGGC
jgi:hypothetical protein